MTEHKYVFQGPVGQMQLSHCTVYVQGIVQKLTTEDCEVNVTGIVNQRFDMNKRVFVAEPPKTNADIELAEKRRENSNLRWQVQQLQSEVRQLKQKNKKLIEESKQPAEVPDDDVLVHRIIRLQEQIEKEREAHAKELDDLKAKGDEGWKDKHDKLRKEYDDYKNEQTAKETRAAKEKAVRAYYESKNITGTSLDIAMKASGDEINGVELDDKGAIKDAAALDALVGGTLSGLVSTTVINGVRTPNPPANNGKTYTSKAEIMAIKDAGERQKAIAQNMDLFTKKG